MVRFVSSLGHIYRVLRQEDEGAWLISFDEPASPFFVSTEEFAIMERIETPASYLLATAQKLTQAAQERLDMLQPLLTEDVCIANRDRRLQVAKGIAEEHSTTTKRVLRLYYRYLATGILTGRRNREPERKPDFEWAIQKFYFSSKQFSLRATFDMLLVQRYTDGTGRLVETAPTWSSFQHYYYRSNFHKTPQRVIARQGLSHYQRNVRPMYGAASSWRDRPGCYQMDATQADIFLVSRHDRSSVIGRPYEGETFVGLMLYWETEAFRYVEHFCMLPEYRGQGLGGKALELLAEQEKTIILEIDPPVDEIAWRRKGFYERSGFVENPWPHVHPPYHAGHRGHDLVVMSRPEGLNQAQYTAFARYLENTVMANAIQA